MARTSTMEAHLVSIHAPARGATLAYQKLKPLKRVSIHAPARGATVIGDIAGIATVLFQSTHPRGVRRLSAKLARARRTCFNPRTREGCDPAMLQFCMVAAGFNPRTREGCDTLLTGGETA